MSDFWSGVASFLSPVTNFVSGLFTNASNEKQVADTNATNLAIANNTNNANMLMNKENISFQERENQIAREREDNAVQRRASDMVAAGLSKTLAAGSPASANAMNAPNNQFAAQTGHPMQAFRAEAPQLNFDYAQMKNNLASANAAPVEAEAAKTKAEADQTNAETAKLKAKAEIIKMAKDHGLDLRKYGLDVDKFEHQKYMDEKEFALKDYIQKESLNIEKKKYDLSVDELKLKRDELNNKILDSISERDYRSWQKIYQSAELQLDKNADARQAEIQKYNITEIDARVQSFFSQMKLNDAEVDYYKKYGKFIISQIVEKYAYARHLSAQTKETLVDTIIKIYNLGIARNDNGKTTDHTVTSSEAHENALGRATQESVASSSAMKQMFSIVLMSLFGYYGFGIKVPK